MHSARALNVLTLLTAYQAELCKDFGQSQDPATWEEIPVVTDLCLHVQCCAVQATGRALGVMVLQERAQQLNLAYLSDREKDDVLDMPTVPEGIFGPTLALMQRQCKAKKKEDEALQRCLPRKPPAPSPPVQCKTFAQAASEVSQFKIPKLLKPQHPTTPAQSGRLVQEALSLGCSSAGTACSSCPGQKEEESSLTAPLSTGDAAGHSPHSSSTCLASERAPRT